ncbi:hypothetical protein [Natrinema salaciae]|uniref:Uncharacterized protein n=1 Tax=Natrinema salaciae TaxID=1186196 RepID=A0A1H9GSD9_9EURY|nr:hypothetical protein [Natrinema salaciae]SEQ52992.1 hypothetical protein SAMN04489841_1980 [Natrinema salaciae]
MFVDPVAALNVPLGPPELIVLFAVATAVPVLVYRDARRRDIDHPVSISGTIFVLLLIGIVPGVLGTLLYVHLRRPAEERL